MEWDSWDGAGSLSRRATGSQCGERGWGNWPDWPGRTPRPQEKESGTGWRLWETLCSVTEGVGLADVGLVWVEPRAGTDEAAGAGSIGEFHLGHFLFILAVCWALCGTRAHTHTHRHTIHTCTHDHTHCMHMHTHTTHMHTHTCTHTTHMHTHTCTHMQYTPRTYALTTHTHTLTHIHHTPHTPHTTHTHTHTCTPLFFPIILSVCRALCGAHTHMYIHTQTHTPLFFPLCCVVQHQAGRRGSGRVCTVNE